MNPGLIESVRVTAQHHALSGQIVRVARRKRHRGEAHLIVEVSDGSRQLIAVRNTELADARSSTPDLCFTPGSLRALVDMINEYRCRLERGGGDANAFPTPSSGVDLVPSRDAPTGREALDRASQAPAVLVRRGKVRRGSR
jgi:hypothetical protein